MCIRTFFFQLKCFVPLMVAQMKVSFYQGPLAMLATPSSGNVDAPAIFPIPLHSSKAPFYIRPPLCA